MSSAATVASMWRTSWRPNLSSRGRSAVAPELGWRPLPQLGGEQLVQGEVEARALGSTVGNRLVASLVEHLFQLGMVGAHQDGALVGVPRVQGGEVDAVPAVASWPEQPVPHLL